MNPWHDALLLERAARALALAACAALGVAGLHAAAAWPVFAIRHVVVQPQAGATLERVGRAEVERAVLPRLAGTVFTADLGVARAAFESLPWVRAASVRRVWPDRLLVTVETHRALARWNDDAGNRFVSVLGEAFDAPGEAMLGAALPLLIGPETAAADVARRYGEVRERVAAIGKQVAVVSLSARQAWSVRLSDGLILELGREQPGSTVLARLERFVAHHGATVGALAARVEVVDLRYPNGFAARVPALRLGAASSGARPGAAPGAPKRRRE